MPNQWTTAVKLKPDVQKALDMVLSKGLLIDEYATEDIEDYLQKYSLETRYVIYRLTGNMCYLGDGNSILRRNVMPNLCQDLDKLLQQDSPSEDTLEHAIWMASKLGLKNVISFLVYMGAPADKSANCKNKGSVPDLLKPKQP